MPSIYYFPIFILLVELLNIDAFLHVGFATLRFHLIRVGDSLVRLASIGPGRRVPELDLWIIQFLERFKEWVGCDARSLLIPHSHAIGLKGPEAVANPVDKRCIVCSQKSLSIFAMPSEGDKMTYLVVLSSLSH